MTKKISAVWAQDENGLIGKDGTLPWSLPADWAHFKETTTGHAMVMGRVTFDGMGRRALPNRISIVLTQDKDYTSDSDRVLIMHTVDEVLDWYHQQDSNLYIIGGRQIFSLFEEYLDEVVLTQIHASYAGDTYFDEKFNWSRVVLISETFRPKDTENKADFTVKIFAKKES